MSGPSTRELLFLWLIGAVFFVAIVGHFQNYGEKTLDFGDNGQYISAAQAIQHWNFRGTQTKQGWGLSYLVALLATFGLSYRISLLLISTVSSVASVLLARSLWGGWIAAFFAILNFAWIQASYLGSSEPLFVLLVFASFWFGRRERWVIASVLAALATLTRPVGIFVLFALGLTLVLRKEYRKAAVCTLVAVLIGLLYLAPFWISLGDPLYQFHRYQHEDWESGSLLTWPFHIFTVSFIYYHGPWTNVVYTGGWIALAILGYFKTAVKLCVERVSEHWNEQIFFFSYLMFLFCYNSLEWARWDFPRFVIPAIPLLLLSVKRWLPKSRYAVYPLCVICAILAAASAVGIRTVMSTLR